MFPFRGSRISLFVAYLLVIALMPLVLVCSRDSKEIEKKEPAFDKSRSDAKAIELADAVLAASGGQENWDKTRYVTWRWLGKRLNVWDKHTGDIRVGSRISVVLMNLNTKKGKAWQTGSEITDPDELQRALDYGYEAWMNDSYWLFMPFKLKDPGVILKYLGEGEIEGKQVDMISVTFDEVGATPHNKYHVYIDKDSKLVVWWEFYLNASDENPRFKMPWKNYQKYGGILLSDDRGNKKHTEVGVFEELPPAILESFDRVDLTEVISQNMP